MITPAATVRVLLSSDRSWSPHIDQTLQKAGLVGAHCIERLLNLHCDDAMQNNGQEQSYILLSGLKSLLQSAVNPSSGECTEEFRQKNARCQDLDYWIWFKKLK